METKTTIDLEKKVKADPSNDGRAIPTWAMSKEELRRFRLHLDDTPLAERKCSDDLELMYGVYDCLPDGTIVFRR